MSPSQSASNSTASCIVTDWLEMDVQVQPRDFFWAVDDNDVSSLDEAAVALLFRGRPSTPFTLTLFSASQARERARKAEERTGRSQRKDSKHMLGNDEPKNLKQTVEARESQLIDCEARARARRLREAVLQW